MSKAIVLLSGGLDSSLVLKMVKEQGVEVLAVKFTSPFCTCDQKGKCFSREIAEKSKVPYLAIAKGEEYLEIIRNPKHGYGKGMNPCIDCRIYMLKRTKELMEKQGADFVVTGEVLGQRPMSQHMRALQLIEKESGLAGKILRPLSAKVLPLTEPEIKGWVDREKFLNIQGRSRKEQLALARDFALEGCASPAGGCLLTQKDFARKVRDLFQHRQKVVLKDILLLKIGRHFRAGESKIIVGRNENENKQLESLKDKTDFMFEVEGWVGPVTVLQEKKDESAIKFSARLTALYSDCTDKEAVVCYEGKRIRVSPLAKEEADKYNLSLG